MDLIPGDCETGSFDLCGDMWYRFLQKNIPITSNLKDKFIYQMKLSTFNEEVTTRYSVTKAGLQGFSWTHSFSLFSKSATKTACKRRDLVEARDVSPFIPVIYLPNSRRDHFSWRWTN
ncbi:hypothetical protein XENORESO_003783 [Xenotaenia resolanae]|uniref:Uncharacterized protein n=1 Tax=Xenotaenia resolanae TaxID=208358 RepID=A0ABV0VXF6_9TELE